MADVHNTENKYNNGNDNDNDNDNGINICQPVYTENGALSLSTTQPNTMTESIGGRVALFFKTVRSLLKDTTQLYKYLSLAHGENVRDTLVLVFHLRNCRKNLGGKGERDLFRLCVEWYKSQDRHDLIQKNLHNVVKFGRWDDVLICPGGYKYFAQQLLIDYHDSHQLIDNNHPISISLAAKWAPSACSKNKSSKGKHLPLIKAINEVLCFTNVKMFGRSQIREVEYRKMLSKLREHLKVVERLMATNRWDEIDFNKVPSNAMYIYGKEKISYNGQKRLKRIHGDDSGHGAFIRHRPEDFSTWKEGLKTGKDKNGENVKVNASQLFPYQLVAEYLLHKKNQDQVIEAQWKVLENNLKEKGGFSGCLFVTDVSRSMTATISANSEVRCLDVAISLSLLGARGCQGPFKDSLITFSTRPTVFTVKGQSLFEDVEEISKMNWAMNTNLQSVFDLILETATKFNVNESSEIMPKYVVIISDMEFDQCTNNHQTNFQTIREKYQSFGYQMPVLVFWNVRSSQSTQQFPVSADENGTILLSGFSSSVMNELMEGNEFKNVIPWKIIRKIIDSDIYKDVIL